MQQLYHTQYTSRICLSFGLKFRPSDVMVLRPEQTDSNLHQAVVNCSNLFFTIT